MNNRSKTGAAQAETSGQKADAKADEKTDRKQAQAVPPLPLPAVIPKPDEFRLHYEQGAAQLVYCRMVSDLETPVSVMLKLAQEEANSFLFESVEGGESFGRYSVIGLAPDIIWRAHGDQPEINRSALKDPDNFRQLRTPTLESLRHLLEESRIEVPAGLPPMAAGVFGYLGFDIVRLTEHLPDINPDRLGLPDAILLRPTIIIIFDALKQEMLVITPVRVDGRVPADKAYEHARERLGAIISRLAAAPHIAEATFPGCVSATNGPAADGPAPRSNTPPERYYDMVRKAKDYIAAGDIFQVVLSQRFEQDFDLPPFSLYRALRRLNPSPYLFFLNFGGFAVVGSSPELLVRVRDGEVTIRPIAGTRPRGATPAEDQALAEELLQDPKELAEHLMLLDLGRNDVGRVAVPGTVQVTDSFFIERYSQVMHIVSNVTGMLAPDEDTLSALMAGFPAGTVSGAPKVRAMEIIDELELDKRGIYAGAVGYFSADGNMDSCIALRTSVVKDGKMYVQAGGGIVADSVPENEQQESINKAKAQFRAAAEARRLRPDMPERGNQ